MKNGEYERKIYELKKMMRCKNYVKRNEYERDEEGIKVKSAMKMRKEIIKLLKNSKKKKKNLNQIKSGKRKTLINVNAVQGYVIIHILPPAG